MRGTTNVGDLIPFYVQISTHVPRAGDDQWFRDQNVVSPIFQPTSPVRGTTLTLANSPLWRPFQPTSPVRGTTPVPRYYIDRLDISTHVPRAGDDLVYDDFPAVFGEFQPTSPVRGTTPWSSVMSSFGSFQPTSPVRGTTSDAMTGCSPILAISTHVPRAGDDFCTVSTKLRKNYFNPRPPCGGRPRGFCVFAKNSGFQPTSPVRGTTVQKRWMPW